MPTACIHVFSATGNSLNAAKILECRLNCAKYSVKLVRIDHTTLPPAGPFDLNIVISPVYAFDIPEIVRRYLCRLPPGGKGEAVAVVTIGALYAVSRFPWDSGDEGGALEHIRSILTQKGYSMMITDAVMFPSNFTAGRLCAAKDEVPGILRHSEEHMNRIADSILTKKKMIKKYFPLVPQIWIVLSRVFYHSVGRRGIGKLFIATKKCSSCGLCARTCPAGAIAIDRLRPRWNYQCEGCHRCINTCPLGAIECSGLRLLTMMVLIFVPYASIFNTVLAFAGLSLSTDGIVGFLAWLVLWISGYTVSFVILDVLYSVLERPPADCTIALIGYTRGAFRYVNPPVNIPENSGKEGNSYQN